MKVRTRLARFASQVDESRFIVYVCARLKKPVLQTGIHWIRILLFSSMIFKTSTKNNLIKKFFAYYFLKVHLHQFSKIKSHKEVTKRRNQCFSYYFCLIIEESGSGSVSLTNGYGCGSGRPKNIWIIRIWIRKTDKNSIKSCFTKNIQLSFGSSQEPDVRPSHPGS